MFRPLRLALCIADARETEGDGLRLTAYGMATRSHCERVAMAIKKLTIFQEAGRRGGYARSWVAEAHIPEQR